MARRTTLVKLLDYLRAETRSSLNPAHNAQARAAQVIMLQRVQGRLWDDFDWGHLRVERQVAAQAGQRFYAPPEDIAIDRIEKIEFFSDGVWRKMLPGIEAEQYAAFNSELDQRSWPMRRWKIHEDESIEIWPLLDRDADPETREGYLKFTGIRNLRRLVDDADRADLDDQMIVLFAAAEMLAASGGKDAKLKLDQANSRYRLLRGRMSPKRTFAMFGLGEVHEPRRPIISQYRRAD